MWDRRMIGVPNSPGKKTIYIGLPEWWPAGWTADTVAPSRVAEVGGNCLTYVTVLSAFEAAQINESFKRGAEKGAGYSTHHTDKIAMRGGAEVDKLLEAIKQEGYFSSWVVIEECTID